VQQSHDKSLVDALCRHLKGRQLLLVVDNCEHVVEAAAAMVEAVLRGAPEPTIVATSRESLRVPGEQIYRLPPLSLPGSDGAFESIRKSEAVQLFVDRAQHQQHDFALTVEGAAGVAELCVRLDGLPLALELAAAHVHTLAIDEINARLDDRFRLLTAGSRSALPRQKTLQGTLDWSFGLLSELERVVLRRIAVFSGAFTADAAAHVAGDATLDAMALAPTVAQLALRSLVVADSSRVPARYRLLETTRTYALERLAQAGESESVRASHSRWVRSLFGNATDEWMRDGESQWRDRYAAHVDDLRAALEWSMSPFGDAADAVAIAGSSGPMWSTLGRFVEGARWLQRASVHVDPRAPSRDGANVWLWLGVALEASPEAALDAFDRSLAAFCAINDAEGCCHAQIRRARALAALGKFDAAHEALADAAQALRHVAPPKLHAFYFSNSAFLANMRGDTDRAGEHYRQALVHYREAHHEFGELVTLDNIAEVNWSRGALEDAANAFRESVELRRTSRASRRVTLAFSLANLAGVLTELGHLDEALACEREAVPNLLDEKRAWIFIDHFALRAGLAGKLENAARIAGYASRAREVKKWTREPNEARACARLHALLREQLPAADVECLLAEGANLSAHDACRLALEE
jgi:predicted ATPase